MHEKIFRFPGNLLDRESASEPGNVRSCKDLLDGESVSEPWNVRFDQSTEPEITEDWMN